MKDGDVSARGNWNLTGREVVCASFHEISSLHSETSL